MPESGSVSEDGALRLAVASVRSAATSGEPSPRWKMTWREVAATVVGGQEYVDARCVPMCRRPSCSLPTSADMVCAGTTSINLGPLSSKTKQPSQSLLEC